MARIMDRIMCVFVQDRRWSPIRDIVQYWPEWIIMLALLSLQIALTFALPVPDCPTLVKQICNCYVISCQHFCTMKFKNVFTSLLFFNVADFLKYVP